MKRQFAVIFCLLITGTILLCLFINNTFLEDYYLKNKQDALESAYQVINKASNEGNINSEQFDIELKKLCEKNNISFIIVDAKSQTLKTSTHDYQALSRQLMNNLFGGQQMTKSVVLEEGEKYEIKITRRSVI